MLHGVCDGGRGTWQLARDVDVVVVVVAEVALFLQQLISYYVSIRRVYYVFA